MSIRLLGLQPLAFLCTSRNSLLILFAIFVLGATGLQASLVPGDIAFVGMNTDGSQDDVAFVALTDLAGGSQIHITDAGWDINAEDFRPGETMVTYQVPAAGLPKGSVVRIYLLTHLSSAGDQVTAYVVNNGVKSPIASLNAVGNAYHPNAINDQTSAIPKDLAQGHTAVTIPVYDNMVYNGPTTGSRAQLLQAIHDPQEWTGSSTYLQTFNHFTFNITPSTNQFVTLGELRHTPETGGPIGISIFSEAVGNHSVTLEWVGGSAQPGADATWSGSIPINFASGREQVVTLPILDDSDCETTEDIQLRLTLPNGAVILANDLSISIKDDDATVMAYYQGFENSSQDSWNYNIVPVPYNSETGPTPSIITGQESVWDRVQTFDQAYFPPQGTYFWGIQDIDNAVGGGNFDHIITFDPVPLSNVSNGVLSFKYFTFNPDTTHLIRYAVEFDNGSNWTNFVTLPVSSGGWITEQVNLPATASHVRLAIYSREGNSGVLCGGLDEVQITGTLCPGNSTLAVGALPSVICISSSTFNVPFSATGTFSGANVFSAELSDANGSFTNPIALGSLALGGTDPAGVISAQIPSGLPPGTGYRVRIAASSPNLVSPDNGSDITFNTLDASLTPFVYGNGFHTSCPGAFDGSIDLQILNGSGPFTYAWTGPNGFTASSEDIAGLEAGTYQVTLNGGGCNIVRSIDLLDPAINLQLTAQGIDCYGDGNGSITAQATGFSGTVNYNWTGPNGFSASGPVHTNLEAGTYVVTASDGNGCSLLDSVAIAEPDSLSLNLTSSVFACGTQLSCYQSQDGSIDLTVVGGTAPFTYQWTGTSGFGAVTQDISGLAAGNYAVQVTDVNGCIATATISLAEPAPLQGFIEALTYNCGFNVSCANAADGVAYVVGMSGGCPPYQYAWSNGATTDTASGLAADITYSVTITDANGCSIQQSVSLSGPAALAVTPQVVDASCDATDDGSIQLQTVGGCLPHTITWTGPGGFSGNGPSLDSLSMGSYDYVLIDGNGCSTAGTVVVDALNDLSASLGCCQDTAVCMGDVVTIDLELTGNGPFQLVYLVNGDTQSTVLPSGPTASLTLPILETTTLALVSVTSSTSNCEGTVCGSVTIGANACNTSCEDLCVNTGVVGVQDNGNCRSVTLEIACDTACLLPPNGCPGSQVLSFNQDPNGNPIPAGTIVGNQWASMGVTFSFVNNNPNKVPTGVIFDSGNPTGGDWDLGTPHQDFGGPGIGPGGAAGMPGENSVAIGNLLVLAENTTDNNNDGLIDDPDDEGAGGEMQMNFAYPYYVESLSMVDLDNGNGIIRIHQTGNRVTDFNIPGLGDNAVTEVPIQLDSVVQLRVILPGSGGISALAYCPVAPGYIDVSVPCGTVNSVTNNAGLTTEILSQDSISDITGVRIYGLPSDCIDSTGQAAFQLTYEVCGADSACGNGFCLPMVAFHRNGCVQYEMAVMGPVAVVTPEPPSKDDPLDGARLGDVQVYPNPLHAAGTIRMYLATEHFVRVDVYDLSGKQVLTVYEGKVESESDQEAEIQTADLPDGMYILRMVTDEGAVYTRRFVKAHQ